VGAVKVFKSLNLDRTSINCQVGSRFTARLFLSEIRDFCHLEDIIHSVGVPVSDTPPQKKMFIQRKFGV